MKKCKNAYIVPTLVQGGDSRISWNIITEAASRAPWAVVAVSVAQAVAELVLGREQKLELALFKT